MNRHASSPFSFLATACLLLPCALLSAQTTRQFAETARPAEQIDQTYPYDITLADAEARTFLSSSVFPVDGRPTVLLFWLTTCGPCRMELAAIAAKYGAWKETADFNLMAISIDYPHNREAFVQRVRESKWPFPAYLDVHREFGEIMPGKLNGLPQVFVLDGQGNIVYHKRKYAPGDEDLLFGQIQAMQGRP